MAIYNLNNLDEAFPNYEQTWKVCDALFQADPDAMVVLILTRSTACSEAMFEVLARYRWDDSVELHFRGHVDEYDCKRVSAVLTAREESS